MQSRGKSERLILEAAKEQYEEGSFELDMLRVALAVIRHGSSWSALAHELYPSSMTTERKAEITRALIALKLIF